MNFRFSIADFRLNETVILIRIACLFPRPVGEGKGEGFSGNTCQLTQVSKRYEIEHVNFGGNKAKRKNAFGRCSARDSFTATNFDASSSSAR